MANKRSLKFGMRGEWLWVVAVASTLAITGCAKKGTSAASPSTEKSSAASRDPDPGSNQIVGHWLGVASIDEAKLQRLLDATTDPNQRQTILATVESFKSISIAAFFGSDHSLQMEVEIANPGSAPIRESSQGTWKMIEQSDEFVIVETIENPADREPQIKQVRYDFVDQDHFSLKAPTNQLLRQLDPRFAFERRVGQMNRVAEEPGNPKPKQTR